jgi:hypothetical protein
MALPDIALNAGQGGSLAAAKVRSAGAPRFWPPEAEDMAAGAGLWSHAEPAPRARGAEKLWVSVPLRRAAELRVRVFEPQSGYVMVPKRRTFEPGKPFSWRRARVLRPAGIEAEELYVLASHGEPRLYYPARLTTGPPPVAVTRYVFRFRSGGGVAFDVTIAREEKSGRLVEVDKRHREEEVGGILDFAWDGRGKTGAPEPAGVYHLKLEGTVADRPAPGARR